MRIISGTAGSRRLRAPSGAATRPTADRVRQSLFDILGPPAAGAAVLDLYAGTGSLGLEALSRGAARAVLVDRAPAAIRCIEENAAALAVGAACKVIAGEVLRVLPRLAAAGERFDWVFVDPPYQSGQAPLALAALADGTLLAEGAVVVVEHDRREPPAEPPGPALARADRRRYGDTELSFYRRGA